MNKSTKTHFRVHYKKLFKTVNQIAKEAEDNVLALQEVPQTPNDFGISEYDSFNPMKSDAKPNGVYDHFEHVMDEANQMLDQCYVNFEKQANQLFLKEKGGQASDLLKGQFETLHKAADSNNQLIMQKQKKNLRRSEESLEDNSEITQNIKRRGELGQIKKVNGNDALIRCGKRPFTAGNAYKCTFQGMARSSSPVARRKKEGYEQNRESKITLQWKAFFQETDKNLQQYQNHLDDQQVMKQPITVRSFRTEDNSFQNRKKSAQASRDSNGMIQRVQEKEIQIEMQKIQSLLKEQLESGFDQINLKQVFLTEKAMELLLASVNTSPKCVIQDVFSVASNYIYLLDSKLASKITKFIPMNSSTRRYVYREVCEHLEKRLQDYFEQLNIEKRENQELNKQIALNQEKHKQEIVKAEKDLSLKMNEMKQNAEKELQLAQEKLEKQKNENMVLNDGLRQLKRELAQVEQDKYFKEKEATSHFEEKYQNLLVQFNSLQTSSNNNDLRYTAQYDCMSDLVDNHQSAIVKLRLDKEIIESQNLKIEQLLSEISRLNIRASTQFNDLTPRPSLSNLESICRNLNDLNFRNNSLIQKSKLPTMKYSEQDSVSKIQKISETISAGLSEYKECINRLKGQKSESFTPPNSKTKQKQQKYQQQSGGSKSKSREISQFSKRKASTSSNNNKKESTIGNNLIKKDLTPADQSNRTSVFNQEFNLSDNLSLNSEDRLAIQKHSIDDYEDMLNDF